MPTILARYILGPDQRKWVIFLSKSPSTNESEDIKLQCEGTFLLDNVVCIFPKKFGGIRSSRAIVVISTSDMRFQLQFMSLEEAQKVAHELAFFLTVDLTPQPGVCPVTEFSFKASEFFRIHVE